MPILVAADMSVVYHNGKPHTREASQKLMIEREKKKAPLSNSKSSSYKARCCDVHLASKTLAARRGANTGERSRWSWKYCRQRIGTRW